MSKTHKITHLKRRIAELEEKVKELQHEIDYYEEQDESVDDYLMHSMFVPPITAEQERKIISDVTIDIPGALACVTPEHIAKFKAKYEQYGNQRLPDINL